MRPKCRSPQYPHSFPCQRKKRVFRAPLAEEEFDYNIWEHSLNCKCECECECKWDRRSNHSAHEKFGYVCVSKNKISQTCYSLSSPITFITTVRSSQWQYNQGHSKKDRSRNFENVRKWGVFYSSWLRGEISHAASQNSTRQGELNRGPGTVLRGARPDGVWSEFAA